MTKLVGLMVGREWSMPPALIDVIKSRKAGVEADYVRIGETRMDEPCPYAVIIDRISHEVPYYRTYLKNAVLQGTAVINNPFMWSADDKFFGSSVATKLGVAHPKTVALPNREYIAGIKHDESLRNLKYPLDWNAILDYIGLPCILKDAHGGGWRDVFVCRSMDEVIHHYDSSGLLTMVLQEFIEWEHYVRCLVLGQEHVMPMKYDPKERRYLVEHAHLSPELGKRIVEDSLAICRAFGYDMNSVEFAVRGGVPYAIDFMNPAPDAELASVGEFYHKWIVDSVTDLVFKRLAEPVRNQQYSWDALLNPPPQEAYAVASAAEQQARTVTPAPPKKTPATRRKKS